MAGLNRKEMLVLINGQDRTQEISSIAAGEDSTEICFISAPEETLSYRKSSVIVMTSPDELDPSLYQIHWNGRTVSHLECLLRFHKGRFVFYVFEKDGVINSATDKELEVHASCLSDRKASDCFSYLKELSQVNKISRDDEPLLWTRYAKLDFIDEDSLLAFYLNPEGKHLSSFNDESVIFPFGGNTSQFRAVRKALSNQLTVIQGPPGTGKTLTILNIVANLLVRGKTMLIVSNNNSALDNIKETLDRKGLGYLAAVLGSGVDKEYFLQNQPPYPAKKSIGISTDRIRIKALQDRLDKVFNDQDALAKKQQQMRELKDEIHYFEEYCKDNGIKRVEELKSFVKDSDKILDLIADLLTIPNNSRLKLFFFRMRCALPMKLTRRKKPAEILTLLKDSLYQVKKESFANDIAQLEGELADTASGKLIEELEERSYGYLMAVLQSRLSEERPVFTEEDLWRNGRTVLKEYPVVLSPTSCATSSLRHVKYDYLIMDEASQVDIATGALALSVADNAVVIGDGKQLPNIVTDAEAGRDIFRKYDLDLRYEMRKGNSFLSSVSTLVPPDCVTLLREHYRCEPRIITYCNRKFYNGRLLIMTKEGKAPLEVRKVMRDPEDKEKRLNHRECEVILSEILPSLYDVNDEDIGIICPYNRQADLIKARLEDRAVEVSTVHRFQGREKRVIIFSAVDDQISEFTDDPEFFNVAVSRAKEKFILVVSASAQKREGTITDFISYADYIRGNLGTSGVYAVFDLLYGRNAEARREIMREHLRISEYESENLAFQTITEVLEEEAPGEVKVICHYPMRELIRHPDRKALGERKYSYVTNHLTHLDYLLYRTLAKTPLLAIEINGYKFHDFSKRQTDRDALKDEILSEYGIPLLRISTRDRRLKEKLRKALQGSLGKTS